MFACGSGEDQWKVSPGVCSHPCCKMAFSAPKSVFSTLGMSERLMETWGMQNPSLLSLCHLSPPRGHRGPSLRVLPSPPHPTRAVSRFCVDIQLRAGDLYLIWVKKTHLKDLGKDKLSFPFVSSGKWWKSKWILCQGWMWGCEVPQSGTARAVNDFQRFSLS